MGTTKHTEDTKRFSNPVILSGAKNPWPPDMAPRSTTRILRVAQNDEFLG